MAAEPDFSQDALARFIDYVVDKNLVNPSTAQGWRVATTKVLAELTPEEQADVRRIEVDATFKQFLNRNPGDSPLPRPGSIVGGWDGRSTSS